MVLHQVELDGLNAAIVTACVDLKQQIHTNHGSYLVFKLRQATTLQNSTFLQIKRVYSTTGHRQD